MTLLILAKISSDHIQKLRLSFPQLNILQTDPFSVSPSQLENADIIFGNPPLDLLQKRAHYPRWIHLESAGADNYTKPGILPPNTRLTNSTGAYGLAIAEHALGMLFAISKKILLYRDQQHDKQWKDQGMVKPISGSTALVIGAGDIGCEFAKRIKALGAYTIGIRRAGIKKPDSLDELYHSDAIDRLLPIADTVLLSLPNTPETYHIINQKRLNIMKSDAILLNVGRGTAVDTQALYQALIEGKLLGAGLDVTDPEPLPPEHPLWNCSNVLITPHVSGGGHLETTTQQIFSIFERNLFAFLKDEPLINRVDFSTGYRALTKEERK